MSWYNNSSIYELNQSDLNIVMQQQAKNEEEQQVNPLFLQNPHIPDLTLISLCPPLPYPSPPSHYKQFKGKYFQSPNIKAYKKFSDGYSSFCCSPQGTKQILWSSTQSSPNQTFIYDQNTKEKLKNFNNSIYQMMKRVLKIVRDESRPEQLREFITEIEACVLKFYGLTRKMKELEIQRNLCRKSKEEAKRYHQMSEKYEGVIKQVLNRLYKFAVDATEEKDVEK